MPMPQEKDKKYTYADYLTWPEDEHIELINGVPYYTYGGPVFDDSPFMQATLSSAHQSISMELSRQLANFLKGKPCKVFAAPFTVRLEAQEDDGDGTAIEPDTAVVCDYSKIDDKGCKGAPDLVMEILSPSTARKDRIVKFQQYQRAGVREYWIMDPDTKTVQVCILKNGQYYVTAYDDTEAAVPVEVLTGCTVDLREVFAE